MENDLDIFLVDEMNSQKNFLNMLETNGLMGQKVIIRSEVSMKHLRKKTHE